MSPRALFFALAFVVSGASGEKPDSSAVELMVELVEAGESLDSIWPDFRPSQRPLGIYREDRDLLLLSSRPPTGAFVPVDDDRLQGRGWYLSDVSARLRGSFVIAVQKGGLEFTAMRDDGDLATLIHENFHLFQRRNWGGEEQVSLAGFDAQDSAKFRILLELEDEALIRTWQAPGSERRREHMLDYLALRTLRENVMPDDLVAAERILERREGSARYVDQKALERLGQETTFRGSDNVRAILEHFRGGAIQTTIRARAYISGDTMAVSLDDWMPGEEWKARMIEGGVYFPDLLAEALDADAGQLEDRAAEVKASARYDRRVRQMERDMESARAAFDFADYQWQLVFQIVYDPEEEDLRAGFTTSGSIQHLEDDWMLIPDPSEYTLSGSNQTLRIQGHPVLSRTREVESGKVREAIVLLTGPPETQEGPMEPGEYELEGKPFDQAGIEFEAGQPTPVSLYPFD